MKIVFRGTGSGVVAHGIFFEPGKPVDVPKQVADALLKLPYFKRFKEKRPLKRTMMRHRLKEG